MKQTQKIGKSKDARRVCIWNRAMIDAGFPIGQPISITAKGQKVIIEPVKESRKKVSGVTNHGNLLPVIDMKETKSLSLSGLGDIGDTVQIAINDGRITVSRI